MADTDLAQAERIDADALVQLIADAKAVGAREALRGLRAAFADLYPEGYDGHFDVDLSVVLEFIDRRLVTGDADATRQWPIK